MCMSKVSENSSPQPLSWSRDSNTEMCCPHWALPQLQAYGQAKCFGPRSLGVGCWDFPAGPVVKNLPCNAWGTGSIPSPGGSHMLRATKPVCHHYWAHALQLLKPKCPELVSTTREATAMRNPHTARKSPCSLQLEEALTQQRRPTTASK